MSATKEYGTYPSTRFAIAISPRFRYSGGFICLTFGDLVIVI